MVKLLEQSADFTVPDNKNRIYDSALYAASYGGHEQVVKLLLDKVTDINVQDGECGTALQVAVLTCSIPIVRLLLDRGADPTVRDNHGWMAAMIAFQTGRQEIEDIFRAHGCDPQSDWDHCLVPSILTAPGTSTVKITGNGTVAYSGMYKASSTDLSYLQLP